MSASPRTGASNGQTLSSTDRLIWAGFALLLIAEFLWFDHFTSRNYAWIYPRWNDQVQYLTESYLAYGDSKAHGFFAASYHTLVNPSAQGTLHDVYALIAFSIAGPSRSAALSINLVALIVWQLAIARVARRLVPSSAFAFAAAMLPLALEWPWSGRPGSAVDFRLDHLAMCLFGISLCCGILTDGFRSRPASVIFGITMGATLLTRFLTGTYLVLVCLGLATWLLVSPQRRPRFPNLIFAAFTGAVIAGPLFWVNREVIWNYYFVGHFTGAESVIRNLHLGLGRSIAFVWHHLVMDHLGIAFGLTAAVGIGVLLAGWRPQRKPWLEPHIEGTEILAGLFLLCPAAVLTFHPLKSDLVVGALVPGALMAVIIVWSRLIERQAFGWPARVLPLITSLLAIAYFSVQTRRPHYDPAFAEDARKINRIADYIYQKSVAGHYPQITVAVDQVTDCLDAQILRLMAFERHRSWQPFVMTLPTGIAEAPEELLMERLTHSTFVFLTVEGEPGVWPYDRQMRALLPQHIAWCNEHLKRVEDFTLFGKHVVLYERSKPI